MPAVQHNSVGPNFLSGSEAGTSVPLSDFFIASPSTPEPQIQAALEQRANLVLTPGVYDLNAPIVVGAPTRSSWASASPCSSLNGAMRPWSWSPTTG